MSADALNLTLQSFGLGNLTAFHDFVLGPFDDNNVIEGIDTNFTGVLPNSSIAIYPSLHAGYLIGTAGSSESIVSGLMTGALEGNKLDLASSTLQVFMDGMISSDMSAIIDFEFADGDISNGVIMGCYETGEVTVQGNDYKVASGFNIGVTDRGHLFCQADLNGENNFNSSFLESINVMYPVELSKRNLIGISIGSNIQLSHFDYINDTVQTIEMPLEYATLTESVFNFGTSNVYQGPTFNGSLNNLALFNGALEPEILKDLGEAILSEVTSFPEVTTQATRVTGYTETISYKTGITGYDYIPTGTLEISIGREELTGSNSSAGTQSIEEGERYYKHYTLNNGGVKTSYKEELGKLHSDSGYIYYPTGEDAYDTLGLNDVSESIANFTEVTGITQEKMTINLFGKTPLTGTLSEVSGVVSTPLEETYSKTTPAYTTLDFSVQSKDFKKDYAYYMEDRS